MLYHSSSSSEYELELVLGADADAWDDWDVALDVVDDAEAEAGAVLAEDEPTGAAPPMPVWLPLIPSLPTQAARIWGIVPTCKTLLSAWVPHFLMADSLGLPIHVGARLT